MQKRVLVAYASKYGATAEIAEKIGDTLRAGGLAADVLPVDRARDLSVYQAVILGSALYVGKWQKSAEAFLKAQSAVLSNRPVWIFSSGPTGAGDPLALVEGRRLPAALEPLVQRIQPRDVAVFHGCIFPDKINVIEKWAVQKVVKKPLGDFRDWAMITSWAHSIAGTLNQS